MSANGLLDYLALVTVKWVTMKEILGSLSFFPFGFWGHDILNFDTFNFMSLIWFFRKYLLFLFFFSWPISHFFSIYIFSFCYLDPVFSRTWYMYLVKFSILRLKISPLFGFWSYLMQNKDDFLHLRTEFEACLSRAN